MKSELEEMGVRIYFPSAVEIEVRKRQNCTQLITTPVGTSGALAHRRRSKSVLGIMEQGAQWLVEDGPWKVDGCPAGLAALYL